jgi:RNA-directed DNA polymerase
MKNILEFTHSEAKEYFLKEESYFNFDLPKYFEFQSLIDKISARIGDSNLSDFYNSYTDERGREKATYPSDFEDVNYQFLNNKDGKFAWRPYQLIHPALYVSLVHKITEEDNWDFIIDRFDQFRQNPQIKCYSLPLESETEDLSDKAVTVTNWWQSIE